MKNVDKKISLFSVIIFSLLVLIISLVFEITKNISLFNFRNQRQNLNLIHPPHSFIVPYSFKQQKLNINQTKIENNFAILPHFMLGKSKIYQFYDFLIKKYQLSGKNLNIVLISPNHFGVGKHQFIGFNTGTVCFHNECLKFNSLIDNKIVFDGYGKNKFINSDDLQFKIGSGFYTYEHGLGSHFEFLKKYFPNSKYYSLVITPRKLENLDKLIKYLKYRFSNNTLFLASVDMSHYNKEDFAYLHDRYTLYVLNNSLNKKDYSNLEVDCPACLYVVNSLANRSGKYPHLWYRDSSSTILGKDMGFDNTSRMFIYFDKNKEDTNGITIAFFGDVIYTRGIKYYFPTKDKFYRFLKEFFMLKDTKKTLKFYKHRKLIGVDFAGFNLETPAVEDEEICQKSNKSIRFCSNYNFLYWLKNIGFNILSFANNHAMDGGIPAFENTVHNLKKVGIKGFGFITHGKYYKHNFVYTGVVRGVKFAWHGYDFTLRKRYLEDYCNDLKNYKKQGYLNFVVVHWGIEYQKRHNLWQEVFGRKLIDCGADLIIGAHPHVVQDIGYYKGKLIIYSLGNFIFDQFKIKGGNIGGYILVDVTGSGKVNWFNLGKFYIKTTGIEFKN